MKIISGIKEALKVSSERGMHLPLAYDATNKSPSITLLIFFTALIMTTGSLVAFHFYPDKLLQPALLSLLFLSLSFVFYRMRNLDKVKFDLDDRSIELEGDSDADDKGSSTGASTSSEPASQPKVD